MALVCCRRCQTAGGRRRRMNKEQFLLRLNGGLAVLPTETRRELMADYEDHFRSGLEHGKSEEEIAFELGSPEELAQEALELQLQSGERVRRETAESPAFSPRQTYRNEPQPQPEKRAALSVVRLIMLLFWNLIAIPLWAAGWALVAGLAALVLACLASPLLFAADLALNNVWNTAEFYAVLLLLGIGILAAAPFLRLLRALARSMVGYAKWNARFAMGRN
ncbi:hypothetical protein B9G55_20600 [Saccharibacillus sp. O16]|nr:hypothetical protein B9G55_20600 [Saccharibacillus sp. O16]